MSDFFGLYPVNDGVESAREDMKHESSDAPVITVLREAMQQNVDHSTGKHKEIRH